MRTDPPIREALKRLHLPQGLRVVDEMNIGYGRADVVTIGDELHGYEIKSTSDSLSRLPQQVIEYERACDRCTLVTTMRHADKAEGIIPDSWGLIVAFPKIGGDADIVEKLVVMREATTNPRQEITFLLSLVWSEEIRVFLKERQAARGCRNKYDLVKRLLEVTTVPEIKHFSYKALIERPDWKMQAA